ncbi:helix-turn-helix domain-containing protein [Streptomyces sp. NPDC096040]|uniref:helix-turn-helix domain-containing protein n=1 Tax=Streptomyces sp. NPDC096040 TaxID=3155541 RepID=UPI0033198A07
MTLARTVRIAAVRPDASPAALGAPRRRRAHGAGISLRATAVQCGFADVYHFSRRFRAVYGMPPSTFRTVPPESAPPSPITNGALSALQALAPPSHPGR